MHAAILVVLQDPSIRTGDGPEPFALKVGDRVEFRIEGEEASIPVSTTVNYPDLPNSLPVVFTKLERMARYLSQLRPESPIYTMAGDPRVCRSLALCRGVEAIRFDITPDTEQTINNAATCLKA